MTNYPHPMIAREGWPFIGMALGAAMAATGAVGWLWAIPLWLVLLFCVQFFRDPARPIPGDAHSVLSPADGRIVAIEPVRDPWLEREALK
ncbi:MAG: phosphatidylserine decarboxylase, partial [Pseudomonadota bacterium]